MRRSWLVIGLGVVLAACSAGDGGTGGGGNHDSGTGGSHDSGSTTGRDSGSTMTGGDSGSTTGGDSGSTTGGDSGSTMTGGDGGSTGGDGGGTTCGATEVCGDGIDNNCNGTVDEGCPCLPGMTQRCFAGPPSQAGRGVCNYGTQTCEGSGEFGTFGACVGSGSPQPVVCGGGMDYRCDGMVDEGCACTPGMMQACYSGPPMTAGVGLCHGGMQTCVTATGGGAMWGSCTGEVVPGAELCDGMDHDCDGHANTGCACTVGTSRSCYDGPAGTNSVGLCHSGVQHCAADASGAAAWGACTGEVTPTADTCDGIDRACTGMPSAACVCTVGATRACYDGAAGTRGVGVCHDGTQTCAATSGGADWPTACAGELGPVAEICGNHLDDNCNGTVDEGCGGMVTCPGDQTIPAGSPITLNATGAGLSGFTWTIVSAPTGGASTAVWAPAPPTSATEMFTPYIVGVYQIRVTAIDATGATVSCMFNVTAEPHGLRIQLTWDGTGDLDLHTHDSAATPWFAADDCYYGNCQGTTLPWGAAQDFDNTTANGPENDRIDTPAIGSNYTIAVHNYANGAGRHATIQIFCGSTGGTTPTATYTSAALTGTAAGNCTANQFWKVATVRFTSATACTITPINTYTASSARCTAF